MYFKKSKIKKYFHISNIIGINTSMPQHTIVTQFHNKKILFAEI